MCTESQAQSPNRRSVRRDRKSTGLNSSHGYISDAVFCLEKKRVRLPAIALCWAGFLSLADLVARLSFRAFNQERPVGVVTALLVGPTVPALPLPASRTRS